MRRLLATFLLALLIGPAQARAPSRGISACPAGSPSPNGSTITGPLGGGCTLKDASGNSWTFDGANGPNYYLTNTPGVGTWGFDLNGSQQGTWARSIQINNGSGSNGQVYIQGAGASPSSCWGWTHRYAGPLYYQVVSPTSPDLGNIFTNSTKSTSYPTLTAAMLAASVGDTLVVPANVAGICSWQTFNVSNAIASTTISCGGAKVAGGFQLNADGMTIDDCEVGYNQAGSFNGPDAGVSISAGYLGGTNETIKNSYLHDNDDGVVAGGNNATTTLTNDVLDHNGFYNPSNDCNGFDHNLYAAYSNSGPDFPDTAVLIFSGGTNPITGKPSGSFNVRCEGSALKIRQYLGTLSNLLIGENGEYADTQMNWAIDFPCGGPKTISTSTIEHGPNAGHVSVVSYGEELPGQFTGGNAWNCPPNISFTGDTSSGSAVITNLSVTTVGATYSDILPGALIPSTNFPSGTRVLSSTATTVTADHNATSNATGASFTTTRDHTVTFNNDVFIDDDSNGYIVECNGSFTACSSLSFGGVALSVTVSNSVLVKSTCTSVAACLGPGVVDGGGNRAYTTRAAAGAAEVWAATDAWGNPCCAYPYLPAHP